MTMLFSVFGVAGRFAGDLLTSALGWASSLLFGRVPRSHQIFLVLMMAFSFVWLLFVLGLLVPSIASFLLDATPHPPFIDRQWLGLALLLGVILLPLGVGLAGYLVPATGKRPDGAGVVVELLRGYLLAPLVSGLLIFLAAIGIARKIRSRRHGWSDVHVPIVAKPRGYDQIVEDLGDALASAGLEVTANEAPWVLTVPARLLTAVAGSNVQKLRPDRLIELTAPTLRVGVYPSDIAISGPTRDRTRARAAILSRLATTAAHQTTSAEAQAVEDQLGKLATNGRASAGTLGPSAKADLEEIDAKLLELAVPTDEWDILYRLRLQVERDLLSGARPGTEFPGHASGRLIVGASHGSRSVEPRGAIAGPEPAAAVSQRAGRS
jgi:hypothetical protein